MYYSSDEQNTPDMTGKAFESHLKEKNTAKKCQRREGKGEQHCKKDQIKRREGLVGWVNISADRYVRRKALFLGLFWQRVYETRRQRNSLYGDSKFFGYKHRIHQSEH